MAYDPTVWQGGKRPPAISPAALNKIEAGIKAAHDKAAELESRSGTSATQVRPSVTTSTALPTTGNEAGDVRLTEDTGHLWLWDGTAWSDTGPAGAAGLTESTTYPGLYQIGA